MSMNRIYAIAMTTLLAVLICTLCIADCAGKKSGSEHERTEPALKIKPQQTAAEAAEERL